MNGTTFTLGLVGALAAAGALSRRGSRAEIHQQGMYAPSFHLARFKRDVMRDVEAGLIPASKITSLDDLSTYVDTNDYGGFTDDDYVLYQTDPARDDALTRQVWEQADAWIRGGGLKPAAPKITKSKGKRSDVNVTLGKMEGPSDERSAPILLDGQEIGELVSRKAINFRPAKHIDFSTVSVMLWAPYDYDEDFGIPQYRDATTARKAAMEAIRAYLLKHSTPSGQGSAARKAISYAPSIQRFKPGRKETRSPKRREHPYWTFSRWVSSDHTDQQAAKALSKIVGFDVASKYADPYTDAVFWDGEIEGMILSKYGLPT